MYEKQMELFEDGGNVDKVSGNNIPLGSTAKEVRDDQPAMLSEGEMVVPADVVRYFGVEYFMNLRDQAKIGYKKMEAMGQFGTEEGQTLPDDTIFNAGGPPFTIEDIEVIEDYEEGETEENEEKDSSEKKTIKAANGALVDVSTASNLLPLLVSTAGTLNTVFGGFGSSSGSSTTDTTDSEQDLVSTGSRVAFPASSAKDMMGVETFNYLSSFMPANTINSSTSTERSAVTNYIANLFKNIPATAATATDTTGGDGTTGGVTVDTGGEGSTGAPAPGTGDINTLMSYPTTANIQGLTSFGNLLNSGFGKSVLGAMGFLTSAALNPGQYAPVVGSVQRAAGMLEKNLMGTTNISSGFQALADIPTIQANMANRAARSFAYNMKDMSKQEIADIDALFSLQQLSDQEGFGSLVDNPNATIGITSRGEAVVSFSKGPLAANYNARGEIIGDKVVTTLTPEQIKAAYEKGISLVEAARNAADPSFSPSKTDPGVTQFGGWGGPTSLEEALGISPAALGVAEQGITGNNVAPSTTTSIGGGPQSLEEAMGVSPAQLGVAEQGITGNATFGGDTSSNSSINDGGFNVADAMGDETVGSNEVGTDEAESTGDTGTGTAGTGTAGEVGTDEAESTGDPGGDGGGGDGGGGGGGGGKIVCTMMNHLYGFNLKQNALWLRYAKVKQLDPAYQIGYHKIFTPLVRKMPTNKTIAFALSWLAKQRTNSIKKELKGAKITLYKSIVRPTLGTVCFVTGKLVQKGILKPAKLETLQFNEKP
jgi:hypothetical protein